MAFWTETEKEDFRERNPLVLFDRPTQPEFPYMLELFSRKGDIFEKETVGPCVPIPLGDEVSSPSSPAHHSVGDAG